MVKITNEDLKMQIALKMHKKVEEIDFSGKVAQTIFTLIKKEDKREQQKRELRFAISEKAGDTETLLGTTSDATQLLLFAFSKLMVSLSSVKNIEDVQKSTNEFFPIAVSFLKNIENKEVRLPFLEKGLLQVIADIENRAEQVSAVLFGENDVK